MVPGSETLLFFHGSQPLSVQLSEHDQVCRWSVQEARDNSASNETDICLTLFQPYPGLQKLQP